MSDRLPHEKGFHVSWDQIHRDARALAWRLDGHGPDNGGWRAVALHKCDEGQDRWELYNTDVDFAESVDLAARHPQELERLKRLWDQEWGKYGSGARPSTDLVCRFARYFEH